MLPAQMLGSIALRIAWVRDAARPGRLLGKLVRAFLVLVILGHAALFLVVLVASLALLRVNPPFTALMVYRAVSAHRHAKPVRFVPLRQIPLVQREMILRLEDYRFYQHHGVDFGALREAWQVNASIGRAVLGGSTIPMQLARNLFLTPRKTYFRKYLEILIALEMDAAMPKNRILELYLNCIEWGKDVFGIGTASRFYYGLPPAELGLDQMRRLATIITNPLRYDVETFWKSRQMEERYLYLLTRFPDVEPAPALADLAAPTAVTPPAEAPPAAATP